MADTSIEWANKVWNPLIGCSKISDGCKNCYAITMANIRKSNPNEKIAAKFAGTITKERGNVNWSGVVNFDERTLLQPLSWKQPQKIFVNSLSDLFHENVKDEWIDKIFAMMARCPQHTFQVLTKRAVRMRDYMKTRAYNAYNDVRLGTEQFPPPNIWLGVSVENQKAADERIPLLLETPAAVRWLSCEPLLGEINFKIAKGWDCSPAGKFWMAETKTVVDDFSYWSIKNNGISWVVVGGESGNGARPCDLNWIRSIVNQCKSASVQVFVKQMGANVISWGEPLLFKNKKGGDIEEFPEDLQIREFPILEKNL